ncbi:hypothetical protein JCM21714_2621 [Gracilibacillus boraciitolerans JCM 21714]|uniref:Capsule synthesis protein CapA domain-containing protein n=1 Tax=Gracilibacillus boraciitolerans JCM 21714 TaxID=1298598 RepID=W4VL88_9BACI|nr:CapA family protein [Gracilibacillus boraciitolerans]GAE93534.1 hypothetical protein JCM21714_2621 [Gracilibacillus boraciitolerans JCM 21714]
MNSDQYQAQNHSINKNETAIKETEGEFIASLKQEVTIAAVGDLLIHSTVYNDAWNGERYNFIPMLEPISQYLKSPTITMANQETIMGGEKKLVYPLSSI